MTERVIEWRRKVLSLFSDVERERDKIAHLVDTIPPNVKREIEELLGNNLRQKAAIRLRKVKKYSGERQFHRGDVATQIVKLIEKKLKK